MFYVGLRFRLNLLERFQQKMTAFDSNVKK